MTIYTDSAILKVMLKVMLKVPLENMKLGHIMLKLSLKSDLSSPELFAVCSAKTTQSLYQDKRWGTMLS